MRTPGRTRPYGLDVRSVARSPAGCAGACADRRAGDASSVTATALQLRAPSTVPKPMARVWGG